MELFKAMPSGVRDLAAAAPQAIPRLSSVYLACAGGDETEICTHLRTGRVVDGMVRRARHGSRWR